MFMLYAMTVLWHHVRRAVVTKSYDRSMYCGPAPWSTNAYHMAGGTGFQVKNIHKRSSAGEKMDPIATRANTRRSIMEWYVGLMGRGPGPQWAALVK